MVLPSVGGLQEAIAFLEQEMVVDELLLNGLLHASQWIEFPLQFALQTAQCGTDFLLHLFVLCLSQARIERVAIHGTAAADTGRHNVFASCTK